MNININVVDNEGKNIVMPAGVKILKADAYEISNGRSMSVYLLVATKPAAPKAYLVTNTSGDITVENGKKITVGYEDATVNKKELKYKVYVADNDAKLENVKQSQNYVYDGVAKEMDIYDNVYNYKSSLVQVVANNSVTNLSSEFGEIKEFEVGTHINLTAPVAGQNMYTAIEIPDTTKMKCQEVKWYANNKEVS